MATVADSWDWEEHNARMAELERENAIAQAEADAEQGVNLISQDEYLEHGGRICPACRAERIREEGAERINDREILFIYSCMECGAMWNEGYLMTGYLDVQVQLTLTEGF